MHAKIHTANSQFPFSVDFQTLRCPPCPTTVNHARSLTPTLLVTLPPQIERAEAGQNRPIRTEGANSRARGEAERLAAKKAGVLKQDEAERAREMMAAFVNRMSEERTKMLAAHREVQEYAEALEQVGFPLRPPALVPTL